MALWSRIPLIVTGSYGKAKRCVERAEANIVRRAKEKSRVDSGEMQGGWQSQNEGVEGYVFNPVAHTVHNEFGTIHMSAQPMLRPAIDETMPEFEDDLRSIYR